MPGRLWIGLQTDAMGPYIRRELKLFCGETGQLEEFQGIFGDIWGILGDIKNRGKRRFFRIGRDFEGI